MSRFKDARRGGAISGAFIPPRNCARVYRFEAPVWVGRKERGLGCLMVVKIGEKVTIGNVTGIVRVIHKAECAVDVETANGKYFRVSGLCWDYVNVPKSETATHRTARGKMPTFLQARKVLLDYLIAHGWSVKADLKIPHATDPYGRIRLWFKAQAVYRDEAPFDYKYARTISYDLDIRKLTPEEFLNIAGF